MSPRRLDTTLVTDALAALDSAEQGGRYGMQALASGERAMFRARLVTLPTQVHVNGLLVTVAFHQSKGGRLQYDRALWCLVEHLQKSVGPHVFYDSVLKDLTHLSPAQLRAAEVAAVRFAGWLSRLARGRYTGDDSTTEEL